MVDTNGQQETLEARCANDAIQSLWYGLAEKLGMDEPPPPPTLTQLGERVQTDERVKREANKRLRLIAGLENARFATKINPDNTHRDELEVHIRHPTGDHTIKFQQRYTLTIYETWVHMNITSLHITWVEQWNPQTKTPRHPLIPILSAMMCDPTPVKPFAPKTRASLPMLQRIDQHATLPAFSAQDAPEMPQHLALPGFEGAGVIKSCPSWLLWLYDAAGGESMAQGRGAPWSMRLFIAAILHLPIEKRNNAWHTLRFPHLQRHEGLLDTEGVPAITRWLHPDGWVNERRDWPNLIEALTQMKNQLAHVPIEGIGGVAMIFPSVVPRTKDDPTVEFTIRIPRTAANGARLDFDLLTQYGKESAALYRALLSVSAHLDYSAHHGHPITAEIGEPILNDDGEPLRKKRGQFIRSTTSFVPNPHAIYSPRLTNRDLTTMIGLDPTDKRRRHDARKAFERLHADGVIDLRREGSGLVRIFGATHPPPPTIIDA